MNKNPITMTPLEIKTMKTKLTQLAVTALLFSTLNFQLSTVLAQGTALTYQGRLTDGGPNANGAYDFTFQLFDAASGGTSQSAVLATNAVSLSDGLFTVTLDFGAAPFSAGAARWLEIKVRTNGAGAFGTIIPRQQVTATPYAIVAGNAVAVSGTVAASQITGMISSNNIGAESITSTMLAHGSVGSYQLADAAVSTTTLANGAVTAPKVSTTSNWFALTIANPNPRVFNDLFGLSVAAVGSDQMLIGAPDHFTVGLNRGAAYLFNTDGNLLTTFLDPSASQSGNESFGSAVAAVGSDCVLIGSPANRTGGYYLAGAAFLFSTNGILLATLTNPSPAAIDEFGWSVSAVGSDRVLVGAVNAGPGGGAAFLFHTNGTLLTTFTNPTPPADVTDWFGYSVSAVGSDRVLVGAPRYSVGAPLTGVAYLFDTNGILLTTFTNPTPATNDSFGSSVAALGSDRVLIGAHGNSMGGPYCGAAYLFSTNGTLLTTFANPTPAANDNFGLSVAALGSDQVLIGAYGNSTGGPYCGAAYLFSTNGTLLTTFANPTPARNDSFGYSVAALGNDQVLIGAYQDGTGGYGAGAVYLFRSGSFAPGLVADAVRPRSIVTASIEDGAVTAAKIGGLLFENQIPGLDASKIISGTLSSDRISYLEASKIYGTLADAQLSTNVALRTGGNAFTGNQLVTNGNVGVGTASPVASLHVNGSMVLQGGFVPTAGTAGNLLNLAVGNNSNRLANGISFYEVAGSPAMSLGYDGTVAGTANNALRIYNSAGSNLFTFEHGGFLGLGVVDATNAIHHFSGAVLTTGGAWVNASDRNAKTNVAPVNASEILARVTALPITQWNYKAEPDSVRHLGPMAQDFRSAFGLGLNDTSIATVDESGVALAAIQGLNEKVESGKQKAESQVQQLEQRLAEKETEITELKARLDRLEQLLNRNAR